MALQQTLQRLGHTSLVIDYRPFPPPAGLRAWLGRTPATIVLKAEARYRSGLFEKFRRRHIAMTERGTATAEGLSAISKNHDNLIVGSDQVWNPRWLEQKSGMEMAYFLRVARPGCRRIAYAASFGHAGIDTIEPVWRERIGAWLKDFDVISVREASGVDIVNRLSGRGDARHLADPTFLLDHEYYHDLAGGNARREQYLFCFMLHGLEQDAEDAVQQAAKALNVRVIRCNGRHTSLHKGYVLPSPEGWLRRIRDASFVVTNSFHCLVFCLIYHTPFAAVLIEGPIGSMNSRIVEMLAPCGLGGRIIPPGSAAQAGELTRCPIDWDFSEHTLRTWRAQSMAFLEQTLGRTAPQRKPPMA